jgi:hypothetical protein
MIKLTVPYNWQVDNDSFTNKFRGSSQCGPTSCCIMLSPFIPDAAKDSFVKEFITEMDSEWLKGIGSRKSAFQANYKIVIEKYLKKYNINKKVVLKAHGATIDDIKKALNGGSPVMVSTMLTTSGHYVCLVGVDEAKGVFIFHDPYGRFDFGSNKYVEVKNGVGAYIEYPINRVGLAMEASSKAAMGPKSTGFRIIYLE